MERWAADLTKVYQSLNSRLILERKSLEITSLFAALAALLTVVALTLSLVCAVFGPVWREWRASERERSTAAPAAADPA